MRRRGSAQSASNAAELAELRDGSTRQSDPRDGDVPRRAGRRGAVRFIEPRGNTFTALDVSVYESPESIRPRTLLPPRALVMRFTTSVGNVTEKRWTSTNTTSYALSTENQYGNISSRSGDQWIAIGNTLFGTGAETGHLSWSTYRSAFGASSSQTTHERSWHSSSFYPSEVTATPGLEQTAFDRLVGNVAPISAFSLGLRVLLDDRPID